MGTFAARLLKLIGLLLLAAAILKGYGLAVEPIRPSGFLANPSFQLTVLIIEVLLGCWFLLGVHEASAWLTATVLFSVFAVVSFSQGWVGETSCGCFGRVKVNPWVAFIIDISVLVGLFLARPKSLSRAQIKAELSGVAQPMLFGGTAVAVILGALTLFSVWHFGSVEAGLAHLRGERLTAYPRVVDFGEAEPGHLHAEQITLQNWTDGAIRIVGGTDNCSCVTTHDLPIEIPPGESRSIKVSMRAPDSSGAFNVRANLVISDDRYERLPIRLTGVVRNSTKEISE